MERGTNLTEGPIWRKFIVYVIPIILSGFLQQLYNAADTIVVGKFVGDVALAAVGSTTALASLIITLFMGISVGTNVVCARFFGAENRQGLEKALHTSILLGVVLGIPLTLIGWFGSKYFLQLMGTPSDVIEHATLYMKIYFLGVIANLIYNFGSAVMRAMGDTKRPLYILSVAGIANVLLNLICVLVFKLGVVGVAVGTVASQVLSAIAVIFVFIKNEYGIKLSVPKLRFYKKELMMVLSIGIPSGINGILFNLSNTLTQSAINSFGKTIMAGHSVAWNFMTFSYLIVAAGEQATAAFVGQNMGARKYLRIDESVKCALTFIGLITIAFSVLVVSQGRFFLGIFTNDALVVEKGLVLLYTCITVYVLYAPGLIFGAALRGIGKAVLPMVINIMGICALRVAWVMFVWPLNPTLEMVYYSFPLSWIASGVAMLIAYTAVRRTLPKTV